MGMSKPVHVLQRGAEVKEIANLAAIAVVDAQETEVRENSRGATEFNSDRLKKTKRHWYNAETTLLNSLFLPGV
jgi:hypothetical protein